ncbi:MAG: hypothetical protein V1717_03435 [Candidatus Micrarchaeota archaeon]
MAPRVEITRQMRDPRRGPHVAEIIIGRYPYDEPGEHHGRRDATKQEVWANVHGVYGLNTSATRVLFDSPLIRQRMIQRSLGEISGNDATLRHTARILFENHGLHDAAANIDLFLADPARRGQLRQALEDQTVENAILTHSNRPRVKMFYRQPYYHTTAGILTSRLVVADAFVNALLARNPHFFQGGTGGGGGGGFSFSRFRFTGMTRGARVRPYGFMGGGNASASASSSANANVVVYGGRRGGGEKPVPPYQPYVPYGGGEEGGHKPYEAIPPVYGAGSEHEKVETAERTIGRALWTIAQNHYDKDGLSYLRRMPRGSIDPALAKLVEHATNFLTTLHQAYPSRERLDEETMHRLLAAANQKSPRKMFRQLSELLGSEKGVLDPHKFKLEDLHEQHLEFEGKGKKRKAVGLNVNLSNFQKLRYGTKVRQPLADEHRDAIAFYYLAKLVSSVPHEDYTAIAKALSEFAAGNRRNVQAFLNTKI